MKRTNLLTRIFAALPAALIALVSPAVYGASTDISPAPLANAATAVVKPNLMFILDDSGSMGDSFMPDFFYDEKVCKDNSSGLEWCYFSDPAYNNPKANQLYYNPDFTYSPPVLFDGTSMESYDTSSEWAAVPNDGYGIQSTSTINLKDNGISDTVWCKTNSPSSNNRRYHNVPNNTCRLAIEGGIWKHPNNTYKYRKSMYNEKYPYYYLTTQAAGVPDQLLWCDDRNNSEPERGLGKGVYPPTSGSGDSCGLKKNGKHPTKNKWFDYPKYGTWVRVEIKSGNSYPRAASRSDCSGAVGANGCTYTEEMTNFANYWAYYRTRMQAMKTASGRAFVNIDDRYRVGFITINPLDDDDEVDSNEFLEIKDFDASHKKDWFEMFYKQDTGGGTPLREALSRVGRYYGNVTNGINDGMDDDPIQYSCQQNFAILTTDGLWTFEEGVKLDGNAIGDHDDDAASAPRPLLDGESEPKTLADVSQYYYITDLRGTGSIGALGVDVSINNVPGQPSGDVQNDSASHQHMTTFTVGLGVDGTLLYTPDYRENPASDFLAIKSGTLDWPKPVKERPTTIDDLWHAAVNGRAKYFSAKDPSSLTAGLTEALVGVNATVGSAAAAATSNLEPIAGDNYVYIANYETVFWNGDVEARTIDLSSGAVSATPVWSAQTQLDNKTISTSPGGYARTIKFYKPGAPDNLQDFFGQAPYMDATELSWFSAPWIGGGAGGPPLSQWASLTPTQQLMAKPNVLVWFLRGDSGFERQASNPAAFHLFRDRTHVLGDIVNAQPVYVKTVNANYTDAGFNDFKACMNTGVGTGCPGARASNVYVSANDGMLHALNGDTGDERWAFIPRIQMPKLYRLADADYANRHQYHVDGSPTVGDIWDPVANAWKTILVGGLNSGGRGYYALDVTDPNSPKALWEFTVRETASCPSVTTLGVDTDDCDLGLTYGNPVISKLTNGDWVVMVTSGYNNTAPGDGKGYLYVLDPMSGVIENKIKAANATQGIDPGSTTTPMGLAKVNNWVNNTNVNNTTLRVYGGDMEGNLWRFDPNTGTAFVVAQLTDGNGTPQPVTTKPELGEANGEALIAVGTGRYLGASDLSDNQMQTIYTIKDDTYGVVPASPIDARGGTVVEQVITDTTDELGNPIRTVTANTVDLATKDGWRVDMPLTGERINVDPRLQLGTLVVASNIPANDACTAGGTSYLNYFDYKSGSFIASSGSNVVGSKIANSLAVGISVVRLPNKKTVAIVTTSENKYPTMAPPFQAQNPSGRRNSWREITE